MSESPAVVAVIPARGGSQRIPRKNVRDFCGLPMIAHSIRTALQSDLFRRVVVTTDSREIADVAVEHGAEVPFMRPDSLGKNEVPMLEVMAHAVETLGLEADGYACMLTATAPLLGGESLQEGWERISANPNRELAFSALPFGHPVHRGFELKDGNRPHMLWPEMYRKNSQELPEVYHDAGQFYFGRVSMWRSRPENLFATNAEAVVLGRYEVVDIDTEDDWRLAERLFRAAGKDA